jgi:hypothetical protein
VQELLLLLSLEEQESTKEKSASVTQHRAVAVGFIKTPQLKIPTRFHLLE